MRKSSLRRGNHGENDVLVEYGFMIKKTSTPLMLKILSHRLGLSGGEQCYSLHGICAGRLGRLLEIRDLEQLQL